MKGESGRMLSQIASQTALLADKSAQMEHLEKLLSQADESLSETRKENEALNARLEELEKQKEALKTQTRFDLEANVAELDSESARLLDEIRAKETSIIKTQEIHKQLSENLIEWQQSNSSIEQEILLLQQQNETLTNVVQAGDRIGELLNRVRQLEMDKNEVEKRLSEASQNIEHINSEKDNLTSQLNELRELSHDFDALRADFSNLNAVNLKLNDDLQESNEKCNRIVDQYEARLESILSEIGEKDNEIEQLKCSISTYQSGK